MRLSYQERGLFREVFEWPEDKFLREEYEEGALAVRREELALLREVVHERDGIRPRAMRTSQRADEVAALNQARYARRRPDDFLELMHCLVNRNYTETQVFERFPHFSVLMLYSKTKGYDARLYAPRIASVMKDLNNFMRNAVRLRDRGVCALCRIDTIDLGDAIGWHAEREPVDEVLALIRAIGRRARRWPESLWDMDHIIPKCQHGQPFALENLRTLCIECHYQETMRLVWKKA